MKLEKGMSFEVLQVLTDGGYEEVMFCINGFTIGKKKYQESYRVLLNGWNPMTLFENNLIMCIVEVKPVCRLIINEVKNV